MLRCSSAVCRLPCAQACFEAGPRCLSTCLQTCTRAASCEFAQHADPPQLLDIEDSHGAVWRSKDCARSQSPGVAETARPCDRRLACGLLSRPNGVLQYRRQASLARTAQPLKPGSRSTGAQPDFPWGEVGAFAATASSAGPQTRAWVSDGETGHGFYRREIEEGSALVLFGSAEGRQLLAGCISAGTAEAYFPLAEQFMTQSDPPFCGPTTIVMVLNSLQVDPQRVWKAPWRWYSEEMLRHCVSLDLSQGLTMEEFAHLAECNHTDVQMFFARQRSNELAAFREKVRSACVKPADSRLVVSFDRSRLGQSGSGHYSPVAAYHEERDAALIMDVARFKYPPYWVPLPLLWEAMCEADPLTQQPRGYFLISRQPQPQQPELKADQGPDVLLGLATCADGMCAGICPTSVVPGFAFRETVAKRTSQALSALPVASQHGLWDSKITSVGWSQASVGILVDSLRAEVLGAIAESEEAQRALRFFSHHLRVQLIEELDATEGALTILRGFPLFGMVRGARLCSAAAWAIEDGGNPQEGGGLGAQDPLAGPWQAHPQRNDELTTLLLHVLAETLSGTGGALERAGVSAQPEGQRCRELLTFAGCLGSNGVAARRNAWSGCKAENRQIDGLAERDGHEVLRGLAQVLSDSLGLH